MMTTRTRGLDLRRARALLAKARLHRSVAARVEAISAALLGSAYEAFGLVGSAETPEVFVAKLDRFDCVTYVETVLALARSADAETFVEELRLLRYEGGAVEWAKRNHYMLGWARANSKRRAVRPVAAEKLAVRKERTLDAVPGLPPRPERFWCVPKSKWKAFAPRLAGGDVLLFVSTRAGIDVFHCGLLVLAEGRPKLRHASRSAGSVVEQDLDAFLRANRMAGLVALRPQELA